jgi:hypothetical protein
MRFPPSDFLLWVGDLNEYSRTNTTKGITAGGTHQSGNHYQHNAPCHASLAPARKQTVFDNQKILFKNNGL